MGTGQSDSKNLVWVGCGRSQIIFTAVFQDVVSFACSPEFIMENHTLQQSRCLEAAGQVWVHNIQTVAALSESCQRELLSYRAGQFSGED